MTEFQGKPLEGEFEVRSKLDVGILYYVGLVATDWANLEFDINRMIWRLADTSPALGACITAQVYTVRARLDALVALMRIRRVDAALIAEVNKFAETVRGPAELRNRIVHDPWASIVRPEGASADATAARLTITAQRKLVFAFEHVPLADLQNDHATIRRCVVAFKEIVKKIEAALPTLPEIPDSELRPIVPAQLNPTQSPTTQTQSPLAQPQSSRA